MSTTAPQPAVIDESLSDERWQLVHRIISSPPFQKSGRLRDLLQYVTEQTIRGYAHELTEQHIGEAIFHKPLGYSPLEDSSVRVHARQLRLKLHEYFDGVGRDEALIIEIPKGSYAPTFRVPKAVETAPVATVIEPVAPRFNPAILPWILCGVLTLVCAGLFAFLQMNSVQGTPTHAVSPPWPFPQIFDTRHQTVIVVADGNYGMFRILTGERGSLEQYSQRDFAQRSLLHSKLGTAGSRFAEYISNSTHTSFADVANAVALV